MLGATYPAIPNWTEVQTPNAQITVIPAPISGSTDNVAHITSGSIFGAVQQPLILYSITSQQTFSAAPSLVIQPTTLGLVTLPDAGRSNRRQRGR